MYSTPCAGDGLVRSLRLSSASPITQPSLPAARAAHFLRSEHERFIPASRRLASTQRFPSSPPGRAPFLRLRLVFPRRGSPARPTRASRWAETAPNSAALCDISGCICSWCTSRAASPRWNRWWTDWNESQNAEMRDEEDEEEDEEEHGSVRPSVRPSESILRSEPCCYETRAALSLKCPPSFLNRRANLHVSVSKFPLRLGGGVETETSLLRLKPSFVAA